MNAAAIIIALSQLDMLLGIPKGRSDSFLDDIWEMLGYLPQTHLPTLAMSVFALALMLGLKKISVAVQAQRADRRGGHHRSSASLSVSSTRPGPRRPDRRSGRARTGHRATPQTDQRIKAT